MVQPFRCDPQQGSWINMVFKRRCYSTDCRHTFCATCLFEWWTWSRGTTCPACRVISYNPPARDRLNGLVSLVLSNPNETVEPFDADRFVELMANIGTELERNQSVGPEVVMRDHVPLEGEGTAINPLDLTNA